MKPFMVVEFAQQILDMHETILEQQREIIRLQRIEQDYKDLLRSSLQHSQHMASGMLKLTMLPGVAKAIADAPRDK